MLDLTFTISGANIDRDQYDPAPEKIADAYESLMSANLGIPQTSDWTAFAQDVIDEFQTETKFAGVDKLASSAKPTEVRILVFCFAC